MRNSVQFRKALPLAPCPGVNNGCQCAGIVVQIGNGFCQKKKGTALPSPVRVMLFYGALDGAFVRGQQNRPLVPLLFYGSLDGAFLRGQQNRPLVPLRK